MDRIAKLCADGEETSSWIFDSCDCEDGGDLCYCGAYKSGVSIRALVAAVRELEEEYRKFRERHPLIPGPDQWDKTEGASK
jgi:hypothetical protein